MELPGDHTHSRILKSSFEEVGAASGSSQQETTNVGAASGSSQQETTNESSGSVCPQCYPVLSCYKDAFKSMEHSSTELKKTKKKILTQRDPKVIFSIIGTSQGKMNGLGQICSTVWVIIFIAHIVSKLPSRSLMTD